MLQDIKAWVRISCQEIKGQDMRAQPCLELFDTYLRTLILGYNSSIGIFAILRLQLMCKYLFSLHGTFWQNRPVICSSWHFITLTNISVRIDWLAAQIWWNCTFGGSCIVVTIACIALQQLWQKLNFNSPLIINLYCYYGGG